MVEITSILEVEKYLENVNAVIFDLDDTLYSEKDYVKSGYIAISEYFPKVVNMYDKLWAAFKNGEKAIDVVFKEEGILEEKDHALEIYRLHTPKIKVYNGVNAMLNRLKRNKKIGIITDGRPEGQRAKINALGLDVDEIIVTDELGGIEFRKPNIAAFLLMQEKMKVPYDTMVYIGDNIQKDFIAPKKLGMQTIWYKNKYGIYYTGK